MKTAKNRLVGLTMEDLSRCVRRRQEVAKDMQTHPQRTARWPGKSTGVAWLCRPGIAWLHVLLAILIVYEPIAAQQKLPPPPAVKQTTKPVTVDTYTKVVPNVQTTQIISPGSVNLTNVSVKPVPPTSPIILQSEGGTNGNCATPIKAAKIIQDCVLGHSAFESNMVNLYLAIHGQPPSAASTIYQYGGLELRSDIRSFMWAYIQGVIKEDPSLLSPNDLAIFNWIQNAVQNNENAYFQAATAEYNKWFESPCTYQLNATAADGFGLSYDGSGYCGASIQSTLTPLPAPDLSYFKEVGQITAYDSKISQYDGTVTNAALTGGKLMIKTQQNTAKWAALGGLGVSVAAGATAGAIVAGNIASIAPFALGGVNDFQIAEGLARTANVVEDVVDSGIAVADILGAVTIVLVFVQILVQASINEAQTVQNQDAINAFIAAGATTADLKSMLQNSVGYQKVFETFIAATLPDIIQTQGNPVLPQGVAALAAASPTPAAGTCNPGDTDPSCDVFWIINNTLNNQTSVSNHFNYTTWDPAYPCSPPQSQCGNPPFAQYGTSFNAYPFEFGFVQILETGTTNYTFFSPTIRYIDPNTGIRYIADLIDKGRFLVTKAPEDAQNSDIECPVDPILGLTQSPGTQIPSQCRSFVMNTLNIWTGDATSNTIQIPQPPVFATPNAADFSMAGGNYFAPELDSTTQGLPCDIYTSGTLPPGYLYLNGALFLSVPSQVVPGTYQFSFVADCETLGLGTPQVNHSFGTSMTTQAFTANVYGGDVQFEYPTSSTNLTFTQGRSTIMTVVTNGGPGTTITAEANALPPGLTLTDNGNGTATVSGIPTGRGGSCSSACAITASAPGSASASLILKDTVAAPVLPTIPATQSAAWKAAENNIATIDGSAGSNNKPTNVLLSWSVVGTLPGWANFTDHGNNIVTISGVPPVSADGQTIPIQFQYSYGGTPGVTSPTFTLKVKVNPPAPVLRVNPSLLFEVGVPGSGDINSSTFFGQPGLGGSWQVKATLPTGLRETPGTTSLTISGTPEIPGEFLIPIEFTDTAGTTVTRNVAMMITQPASLDNFPSRLVLFVGVPATAKFILPVSAGFPRNAARSPGDGLPSTTGTNLALTGNYPTTDGFTIVANGGSLRFAGTPLTPDPGNIPYQLTVSAQTVLSTGPVGPKVSQPFTLYVQPAGDVNLDGLVNCEDYDLIKQHYGAVVGQPNYLDLADPNRDGVVNILDLAFVQAHLPKGTVCH